ncbi:MAG: ion transporter [Kiritimatiellae bacterium]|nr:ion transporter [Kiritimatiellia bacterium]MDD4341847.1 ion transporter [Kiritimatiellia bacterium]
MRGEVSSGPRPWQKTLYAVIFKADTPAGKGFDLLLLLAIVLSILVVMLSSVESVQSVHGVLLRHLGWGFTLLFTVEYVLRLVCLERRRPYVTSFFGWVDFLSVFPAYLSLLVGGGGLFVVVRSLRILRVFRVLKMGGYEKAGTTIWNSLKASRQKITVFLLGVLSLVVMIGTLMYLIEGPETGFSSIPVGIYWAIVTMTTVGYGNIAPQTVMGQALASLVMILGYSIIAVPTGIVTVDMAKSAAVKAKPRRCTGCEAIGHDADARYCKSCGTRL